MVLNTFSKVLVPAYAGPQQNGAPRIGKNTGAGIMDAHFTYDQTAAAKSAYANEVLLGTVYTRSSSTPNNNNSYMQGGFALAKLTDKGLGEPIVKELPQLNGERAFMRPLVAFTDKYAVLIAASEDNGINNNPQPVMFVVSKATGELVQITNSTRNNRPLNKPTNLIQQALRDGINVNNPNNQRGPHSIVSAGVNSFVVGMQYNNQAQEAFKVTVTESGAGAAVKMDWLRRYSNVAQHCRPQVAIAEGATEGYLTAVEANEQPAEIGFRLTKFNVATGQAIASKIVVRSEPRNNKYVAEPSIGIVGDKVAIGYGIGQRVRNRNGNTNGHSNGAKIAYVGLWDSSLNMVGEPLMNAAPYGRHSHIYTTTYGGSAAPAIAYIGGSSTGTKGGYAQLLPLTAEGKLGVKDAAKLYPVSTYSDVANVQARGKRNPQDQAKGFINGLGGVPNPGFGKGAAAFMPEVKTFAMSTVTGYGDAAMMTQGRRNSLWISLIPSTWQDGLKTTPGSPTDKPGTNPDGTGPAPRSTTPPTNEDGSASAPEPGSVIPDDPTNPDGYDSSGNRSALGQDNGGCSMSHGSSSGSGAGLILLAVAGVIVALRRKGALSGREEEV
ncbi:MAG: hypothetical protein KF819_37770 [Labilithrix sp.]|nr:hypothetical protein [Labilithrix sp.]